MTLEQYNFISNFTAGICLGVFLSTAFYVYKTSNKLYRFQILFIFLCICMGLSFADTLISSVFPKLSFQIEFVNTLTLIMESWLDGFWIIFLTSVVFPEKTSWKTSLLIMIPFAIFSVIYMFVRTNFFYYAMIATIAIYDIIFLTISFREIGKKNTYFKENTSNIEPYDLTWCYALLITMPTLIVFWVLYSLVETKLPNYTMGLGIITAMEVLYCAIWILFCFYIAPIISQQRPIMNLQKELDKKENAEQENTPIEETPMTSQNSEEIQSFFRNHTLDNIDKVIMDKGYFLDYDINLNTLALKLGTNRQYLSNYINKEKHQTFYDYINSFRIERAKQLLADKNSTLTIEDIALESGFKAYSSFIRVFTKLCNQTPTAYRKQL